MDIQLMSGINEIESKIDVKVKQSELEINNRIDLLNKIYLDKFNDFGIKLEEYMCEHAQQHELLKVKYKIKDLENSLYNLKNTITLRITCILLTIYVWATTEIKYTPILFVGLILLNIWKILNEVSNYVFNHDYLKTFKVMYPEFFGEVKEDEK